MQFGLVLPHFGRHASVEKCLAGAVKAEAYGFDSVWVRDHLVFTPYAMEGTDNTHIEGLLVLSGVASLTKKIIVGTAMTICHRHPIHLAQCFAALSRISNGRIMMGMGIGGFPHEFAAAGLPSSPTARARLVETNITLCRKFWNGEKVSYQDDCYTFRDVDLKPVPVNPIPIWLGGSSPAACRRAIQFGDGWLPARITFATFIKRMEYIHELGHSASRLRLNVGIMPLTSIAKNKETALENVNVRGLIEEANHNPLWVKPAAGSFSKVGDIHGLLLAGTAEDIIRDIQLYQSAGATLVVFDLRFRFADWHEQIDLLAKEVLPAFV